MFISHSVVIHLLRFLDDKMIKILCTLFLLFVEQSAFSSSLDLLGLPRDHEVQLSPLEEAEEIIVGFEVEYSAGLHRDLHKTKITLKADFSSFCRIFQSREKTTEKITDIIPNFGSSKIIYPFHSFP